MAVPWGRMHGKLARVAVNRAKLYRVRVFLSYAREQFGIADHLAAALRLERHTVFFDHRSLEAGEAFNHRIREEIRRSDCLLFLISPDSVHPASYARTELEIAQAEWSKPERRIIPVMVVQTSLDAAPGVVRALNVIDGGSSLVARVTFAVDRFRRERQRRLVGMALVPFTVVACGVAVAIAASGHHAGSDPLNDAGLPRPGLPAVKTSGTNPDPQVSPRPEIDAGASHGGTPAVALPTAIDVTPAASGASLTAQSSSVQQLPEANPPKDPSSWRLGIGITLQMLLIDGKSDGAPVPRFWMAETEVTQGQWREVSGELPEPCNSACGPDLPVEGVFESAAMEFTNALSARFGLDGCYRKVLNGWDWHRQCNGFRLPTEAEWELAAEVSTAIRDLTPDRFGFVKTPSPSSYFCHKANLGPSEKCPNPNPELLEVRQYKANGWGLYDMHGNVAELVWSDAGVTTARGGSYQSTPDVTVPSTRFRLTPIPGPNNGLGLRLARTAKTSH